VLVATLQGSIGPSLISESRVLDIRNLDVRSTIRALRTAFMIN
jgi:import inner membrane translocase subunit TIM44